MHKKIYLISCAVIIGISLTLNLLDVSGVEIKMDNTRQDVITSDEVKHGDSNVSSGNVPDPCTLIVVTCEDQVKRENPPRYEVGKNGESKGFRGDGPIISASVNNARVEKIIKKNATPDIQERIDHAFAVSNNDVNFIYLLEWENGGTWDVNKLSSVVGANGYRDKGICQINIGYHPRIVNDPMFANWKWQIETCYNLYKGGTTFYGWAHRWRVADRFITDSTQ